MTGQGRPIRFLALVAMGWIGVRVALLWSETGSLPEALKALAPQGHSTSKIGVAAPARARPAPVSVYVTPIVAAARPAAIPALARVDPPESDPARVQMALLALVQYGAPATAYDTAPLLPIAAQPDRLPILPSRWSASGWLVVRAGTGLGAAPGASQLGGSQAGLRVAFALAPAQRLAGFARVVTPLRGKGAEASLGLDWQPTRAPVRLVIEQRFGLDGTPGGPGADLVGGYDGAIAPGFRLESYGQAGVIRRRRAEPYADGAVRATRTLVADDRIRLALGGGAWGAAQREAARFDIGPSATLALPLGGQNVRLALDWRQRVAGDARPGSGLALTLGSDF